MMVWICGGRGAGGGGERGAQSHIILSGESENIGEI